MDQLKQLGAISQQIYDDRVPKVKSITLNNFLKLDLPPRINILDPWLPKSGIGMIYAKRGVGKTFFALELAMAVAYGIKFLSFKAPAPARVLYIDGEMPANAMKARLVEIKKRMPLDQLFVEPIFITPDLQDNPMPDLSTSEGREAVRRYTDKADLIIIDNISTLCGSGKENEADSWLPLQMWALELRRQGKTVLFIHHAGKGGQQRGTSRREDVLDVVISLRHPPNYKPSMGACFEIHFEKSRGALGESVNSISCCLTDHGWEYTSTGSDSYQHVVVLANEGLAQKDIATKLELSKGQVSKLFNRAKVAGHIPEE
jgi:KaiC/GvpD/RAD55 family RecA-like ATPase